MGLSLRAPLVELVEAAEADVRAGLVVERVEPGSFGANIGLRKGDVVERVGGVACTDASALRRLAATAAVEDVILRIRRDGVPVRIDIGAVLRDRQKQGN